MVLPVAFEISSALLLELPSIYSENNRSVVVGAAELTVIVLLEADTLPAASFALSKTYKLLLRLNRLYLQWYL
jgi:hypothetical protein